MTKLILPNTAPLIHHMKMRKTVKLISRFTLETQLNQGLYYEWAALTHEYVLI